MAVLGVLAVEDLVAVRVVVMGVGEMVVVGWGEEKAEAVMEEGEKAGEEVMEEGVGAKVGVMGVVTGGEKEVANFLRNYSVDPEQLRLDLRREQQPPRAQWHSAVGAPLYVCDCPPDFYQMSRQQVQRSEFWRNYGWEIRCSILDVALNHR